VSAAPKIEPTDADLDIARRLADWGVPIFVAKADPGSPLGFKLPPRWQLTQPNRAVVDTWRPGDALCAVMGARMDLLDVDPRNGGDETVAGLRAAGLWPRSYGRAATPSGGTHDFVARLHAGSRDGVRPGLDVKGGRDGRIEQAGRGFAFIAPTVRISKVTGEPAPYVWLVEPDLDGIDEDDSGQALAELVVEAIGSKAPTAPGPATTTVDSRHTGPIPSGQRHHALVSYAGRLRDRNLSYEEALELWRRRWADCEQPGPGSTCDYYWSEEEARAATLDDVWRRYTPAPVDLVEATFPDLPSNVTPLRPEYGQPLDEADATDAALEADLARNRAVAAQVEALRIKDLAARAFRKEQQAELAPPVFVDLGSFLAVEDDPATHRIDDLWPAGGRVLLAAAFKAGKSTTVGNLIRSLVDGHPFLGAFATAPVERKVVLLDNELDERNLRRWLRDQGIGNVGQVVVVPMRGKVGTFDLLDPTVRSQWAAQIREIGADVVIFDCLRPVLDALGLSEDKDAGRFLVQFDALLAEADVPEALVVHHTGHDGERSRGDSRLRDWPDAEWRITRLRDGDGPIDPAAPRFFAAYGRDVEVAEGRLEYDPASRRLSYVEGNRKDAKEEGATARWSPVVMGVLREAAPVGAKGETLPGWTRNAAWTHLSRLKKEEGAQIPSRRDMEATFDRLEEQRLIMGSPGPNNGRYFTLTDPGSPVPHRFPTGSPGNAGDRFTGSPPLYEGGEPGNHLLSTESGLPSSIPVVEGLLRFTTPDDCPCGRPGSHHSRGQWRICGTCSQPWHGIGVGKLDGCPRCSS
jgi:hypothetical protein